MADYFPMRLRYYNGQFLLQNDFEDEQRYHQNRRMLHGRMQHFWGITEGLVVTPTDGDPQSVDVAPGAALDGDGNLVLLEATAKATFKGIGAGAFHLVISFHEDESHPAATKYVPGNTRFTQAPALTYKSAALLQARDVVLADVVLTGGVDAEVLSELDLGSRTYAGVRLNGPNEHGFDLRPVGDGTLVLERYLAGDGSLTPILHVTPGGSVGVGAPPPTGALLAVGPNGDLRVDAAGAVEAKSLTSGTLTVGGAGELHVDDLGRITQSGSITTSNAPISAGTAGFSGGHIGLDGGVASTTDIIAVGAGTPVFKVTSGGAVTAVSLAAGPATVTSLNVGSGSITGGAISGSSLNVGSGSVTAGAVNGTSLDVGAGTIAGGALSGSSLDVGSGSVTAGAVSGTSLDVGAGTIAGGIITGSSLNVGSGTATAGTVHATSGGIKFPDGSVQTTAIAAGVPSGAIVMWSGSESNIPAGWALCNGQNGTPDLRSRFIVGAGAGGLYGPGSYGGPDTHAHSVDVPATSGSTSGSGDHSHTLGSFYGRYLSAASTTGVGYTVLDVNGHLETPLYTGSGGNHSHSFTVDPVSFNSGTSSGENRPRWYALCFIMKL